MAEYIEREAAIAAAFSATSLGNSAFRDVYDTVNRLRLIPAADVALVRHGRWMHERLASTTGGTYPISRCSECQNAMPFVWDAPYCPNCGAKMDEVDE